MNFITLKEQNFLKNYKHGGDLLLYNQILSDKKIYDFSVNLNPIGPPDWLRFMINSHFEKIYQYPEPFAESLTKKLAELHKQSEDHFLITNGINSIITILGKILQEKYHLKKLLLTIPNYIEYEEKFRFLNYDVEYLYFYEENSKLPKYHKKILWDLNLLSTKIKSHSLIVFSNPNNPTGSFIDSQKIAEFIKNFPNTVFIIDESFIEFANKKSVIDYLENFDNTIVFRSFAKFYHIPGIRLGYVISHPTLIEELKQYTNCWNINTFAIEIGKKAIEDKEYLVKTLDYLKKQKEYLLTHLSKIGQLKLYESHTNYLFIKLEDQNWDAIKLFETLLKEHNISIRMCFNYKGLDKNYFRIAIKSQKENELLINSFYKIFLNKSFNIKKNKKYTLMIAGTSSDVGKSILTTALCRILYQDGFKVAPFKAQNMSLNSYVTNQGEEIAYAQYLQARACFIAPDSRMNPVLIKPGTLNGSQVIVNGKPYKNFTPSEYYNYKKALFKKVIRSFNRLKKEYDVILLEGAGSISEINLKKNDLVNLNMARYAEAPVFLVGDIDRGGVFGSFVGSIEVLNHWEKELIQGYIINKFRGDESLLRPAIEYLEQRTQIPHLGTIPYIKELKLPKEDSMFFDVIQANNNHNFDSSKINRGIIQLPYISNFTDYDPFLVEPDVRLYWLKDSIPEFIDVIIIPGSRNSFQDLLYLKEKGLDQAIVKNKNKFIIGICGGLQILGDSIIDEYGIEFKGKLNGLGLLKIETVFYQEKELRRIRAYHEHIRGEVEGYEIHHGKTMWGREKVILKKNDVVLGVSNETGNVWGTYLHGIFENDSFRRWLLNQVRIKKGLLPIENITVFNLNREIDLLAEVVRKHLNIDKIYKIIGIL